MALVAQVILQADEELRYPTSGELQSIRDFFATGEQRLRIASTLAENEKKIIDKAVQQLWQLHPDYILPGGNAYGQRQRALCLRDYGWYLRLISYGSWRGIKPPLRALAGGGAGNVQLSRGAGGGDGRCDSLSKNRFPGVVGCGGCGGGQRLL
jgi:allophycocyanin-B